MRQHDVHYFARWLVEPTTLEPLLVGDGPSLTTRAGEPVPMVSGVPVFGRTKLSASQLAELSFDRRYLAEEREKAEQRDATGDRQSLEHRTEWWQPWIDANALADPETVLVCLGGAFVDDLPAVRAVNKFNVDHLADVYTDIAAPEIATQDITFVSCPAETLPFATGTVNVVYSRNALDHFDNPLRVLEEVHRVLRPEGTFLFACYFDSTFLDPAETAVVDRHFVDRYVASLFTEVHLKLEPMPPQTVVGPGRTNLIFYVGHPRADGRLPITADALEWSARLTDEFQRALAERVGESPESARHAFAATLEAPPVMPTDAHRQAFAALQLLAMTDERALRTAAQTIIDFGLADDWRSVANLVLNLYGWSLDELPPVEGTPATIAVRPCLDEWKWLATLCLSATALGRDALAANLRGAAGHSDPRALDWIDRAEFTLDARKPLPSGTDGGMRALREKLAQVRSALGR